MSRSQLLVDLAAYTAVVVLMAALARAAAGAEDATRMFREHCTCTRVQPPAGPVPWPTCKAVREKRPEVAPGTCSAYLARAFKGTV